MVYERLTISEYFHDRDLIQVLRPLVPRRRAENAARINTGRPTESAAAERLSTRGQASPLLVASVTFDHAPAVWQRSQEKLAVRFVQDARIEDHDRAGIFASANQP